MVSITIKSQHLCETLNSYGMGYRKTLSANTDLNMIPKNFMLDFIRGYFDGDGTVCVTTVNKKRVSNDGTEKKNTYQNYNWSIISKKPEHLYVIKDYLYKEHGLFSNIVQDSRGNYLIEINRKNDFKKIFELLYEGKKYYLTRKYNKYLSYKITPDKPKVQKLKDGVLVKCYANKTEAARDEGITPQGIAVRINKHINIGGFTWQYES